MATEEYSIGYSEGYQEGWNAAMDSTPPAQPAPSQYGSPELQAMIVARAIEKDRAEQPAPVELTEGVTVPMAVLEAAEASLGSFCSDLGWSDEDMQNMDNLSAYIARHKANFGITKGQPAPVQEPVAHLWKHSQTGRTRIVMPGGIITADATWFIVGPLVLGNTTPPAQPAPMPLTDEQIEQLAFKHLDVGDGERGTHYVFGEIEFTRAIEAKLRSKNND